MSRDQDTAVARTAHSAPLSPLDDSLLSLSSQSNVGNESQAVLILEG